MKKLKRLFCRHRWEWVNEMYFGGVTYARAFKCWKCEKRVVR